jgi:hypothetical protein
MVAKAPEVAQGLLVKGLDALPDDQFSRVAGGMEQVVRILGAEHIIPQPLLSTEEAMASFRNSEESR